MKRFIDIKNNMIRLMYLAWFIFFVISTVFRQYQLFAVQVISVLTFIFLLFSSQVENNSIIGINRIPHCTVWLVIFTIYVHMSLLWRTDAGDRTTEVPIMLRLGCITLLCMELFFSNRERVAWLLKIYLFSMVTYGTVCILTMPIEYWGSDWYYGGITTINRNTASYIFVISFAIALYVYKFEKKLIYLLFIPYFLLLNLTTGSRKGIIQMALVVLISVFLINNVKLKIRVSIGIVILIIAVGIAFFSVPYLQQTYGLRMLALFDDSIVDNSVILRKIVRHNAFIAFLNSPIIGNGVDYSRIINLHDIGYYVYSHCNFTELLCNYGIIGFVLYYYIYLRTIILSLKSKMSMIGGIGLSTIVPLLVIEYGQVTYYIIAGTIPLYVLITMASYGKRDIDCE